jgi:hypothetical protein
MGGTRFSVRYRRLKDPSGHSRFRSMPFPLRHGATGSEPRQCYVRSAPKAVVAEEGCQPPKKRVRRVDASAYDA